MLQETWINRRNAGSSDSSQTFNMRGRSRAGFSQGENTCHCKRWGHRAKGAEIKLATGSGYKAKDGER